VPAPRRAALRPAAISRLGIRLNGGFSFAERPEVEAPDARIIWHADLDPGTLNVTALPAPSVGPDSIDPTLLAPWLTLVTDAQGEHAVLSDGWHHIRLDVEQGSLATGNAVILHYRFEGVVSAQPKILPLRRLLDLCRSRRFAQSLYPPDRRVARWLLALRVHDAVLSGASQSEIARVLFNDDRGSPMAGGRSDSLRSRVRRLVVDARQLASGGYRMLMRQQGGTHEN
jgi:hypothetical protein